MKIGAGRPRRKPRRREQCGRGRRLPGAEFDVDKFRAFLAEQTDLGPKQWPSYVRVGTTLPRTATFKVVKRQLSAEGLDCADPVWPIRR